MIRESDGAAPCLGAHMEGGYRVTVLRTFLHRRVEILFLSIGGTSDGWNSLVCLGCG